MFRVYEVYVANMQQDDPLRQEITACGTFPINMKPSKISDYHNKLMRLVNIMNCSDNFEKYSKAIAKRHEKEAKMTEYIDGRYSILMPRDADEIIREGRKLHHCVCQAGYIQAMEFYKTTILFLRDNQDPDTPLITIEVMDGSIRQCYGIRDILVVRTAKGNMFHGIYCLNVHCYV